MRLIGIGMIGNSDDIVTSLSGTIQEVKSKRKNPIWFLHKIIIYIQLIERRIGLAIQNQNNYTSMISFKANR